MAKQTSRQDNPDRSKSYDKTRKQSKRKSSTFVEQEQTLKKRRIQGSTLTECIRKFEEKISEGPSYICTCCHQTWFSDSVVRADNLKKSISSAICKCLTNIKSVGNEEWICHTCFNSMKLNKIPRLSIANKMGFPNRPKELELYPLEERLISLRIPFMQIHQLPRGGQFCIKGNVVNVPVDIQPTINSLPRTLNQSGTISVKLKKKLAFKGCDFKENVRPCAVICGLHYLMNKSELYKSSGIQIDENWVNEIKETIASVLHTNGEKDSEENVEDSDHFSEIDETDLQAGNTDTLLDEIEDEGNPKYDTEYVFAPGEGQRPLALYSDPDAEYLSFPSIFCGERRPENKDRTVPVQYTDIVKWELRSMDRRVAQSVPNIFFKLKKIQLKNISDRANLALRRCKSEGKKWTAKDILNPTTVNELVNLDEGYFIFRTLRNSPAYLEKKKKRCVCND